jgi:CheY-like chemotaxis protein
MRRLLRPSPAFHHTLIEVEDWGEALNLPRQHRPDVAILDVVMPIMNGLHVWRILCENHDLHNIGVAIISGSASEVDALVAGVDHFIARPFLPSARHAAVVTLVDTERTGGTVLACT